MIKETVWPGLDDSSAADLIAGLISDNVQVQDGRVVNYDHLADVILASLDSYTAANATRASAARQVQQSSLGLLPGTFIARDCACCSDQPTIPPNCPACKGAGGFTRYSFAPVVAPAGAGREAYLEDRRRYWQSEAERLAWQVRELGGNPEPGMTERLRKLLGRSTAIGFQTTEDGWFARVWYDDYDCAWKAYRALAEFRDAARAPAPVIEARRADPEGGGSREHGAPTGQAPETPSPVTGERSGEARCTLTGNPCGTDTVLKGESCPDARNGFVCAAITNQGGGDGQ